MPPKNEEPKTDVAPSPDAEANAEAVAVALAQAEADKADAVAAALEQAERDKADAIAEAVAEALAKAQLEHAAALEANAAQGAPSPADTRELEPPHPPIDAAVFLDNGYHPPTTPAAMAAPENRTGFAVAAPGVGATQVAFDDGSTHPVDPATGRITDQTTE